MDDRVMVANLPSTPWQRVPGERRFDTGIQNQRSTLGSSHLTCPGLFFCDQKVTEAVALSAQKVVVITMNWIPELKTLPLNTGRLIGGEGRGHEERAHLVAAVSGTGRDGNHRSSFQEEGIWG